MNVVSIVYGLFGGLIGVAIRIALIQWTESWIIFSFPIATLGANVLGSFIAGLFVQHLLYHNAAYLFLIIGVCGGLTTMSTCALESYLFMVRGYYILGMANALLNITLSIICIALGFSIAKIFIR